MSKVKRVVSLFIASCLILVASLAGCSKLGEIKGDATTAISTASNVSTLSSQDSTTQLPEAALVWYFPSSVNNDQQKVYDLINKTVKEKINATVEFKPTGWGEYQNKMKVIMAASENYDICWTSNWFNNYQLAVSKGYYLPIDNLLKKNAPNLYASMPEKIWNAAKVGGKIYGVINQQILARGSNMEMPKAFVDKYGFNANSVDKNKFKLEDLEPYLEKFKNGETDKKHTAAMLLWEKLYTYYGMELLGGDDVTAAVYLKDSSLKVFNQFESEQFKQHCALAKKWVDKGYFKAKDLISDKSIGADAGANIGVWFGGTWKPGVEAEASKSTGVPMIERPVSEFYLSSSGCIATMNAISRTSKNPERAMMFLEMINTDKTLYNLLTWGIEGRNYLRKDGDYLSQVVDQKYACPPAWLLATTFLSYLIDGQPKDVWGQTKKINENAVASPILGFTFDPTPVKTESANCSSVVKEYSQGLTYGILSMDKDYPVFIDKLKKAGSDKVVAEAQRQLDEWKKTK